MTLNAAGFPGSVNDIEWAKILEMRGRVDGTNGFSVTAAAGDRTVSVGTGDSNVGGVLIVNDAVESLQLPANPSGSPRKDLVIIRVRWSDRSKSITYRAGTPSSSPQPPWTSIVRNPGTQYEVVLAEVDVASGQGALSSGDITNRTVPPQGGFYYVGDEDQAPFPDHHRALIYRWPDQSLLVGTNTGYAELASRRTNAFVELPEPPPNWDGIVRYVKCNRWVSVNVDLRRTGSSTDGNTVKLGQLPVGFRPPVMWFNVCFNPSINRSFTLSVEQDGEVRGVGLDVGTGQRLRGSITFPID